MNSYASYIASVFKGEEGEEKNLKKSRNRYKKPPQNGKLNQFSGLQDLDGKIKKMLLFIEDRPFSISICCNKSLY